MRATLILVICALVMAIDLSAQVRNFQVETKSDPNGEVELTVCSQNLYNYGSLADVRTRVPTITPRSLAFQEASLIRRFLQAECDVIAVQEVLARNPHLAKENLQRLGNLLQERTNRPFEAFAGPSNDQRGHLGFIVATDRAQVSNSISYARVELPKLAEEQKPRLFVRGPFEIQLDVKKSGAEGTRRVVLVNFHFKSQLNYPPDPASLQWETYRMEMAEALRRIVYNRHEKSFSDGGEILLLLGDRNSHFDTASARILEGKLTLQHFQGEAPCRLSKRGAPLCASETSLPARLFSVLLQDPQTKHFPGTYRYGTTYSWLDDILMPLPSLRFARRDRSKEGEYSTGIIYEPAEASDHALVYVRLNW